VDTGEEAWSTEGLMGVVAVVRGVYGCVARAYHLGEGSVGLDVFVCGVGEVLFKVVLVDELSMEE
jgi:hypothetical protein